MRCKRIKTKRERKKQSTICTLTSSGEEKILWLCYAHNFSVIVRSGCACLLCSHVNCNKRDILNILSDLIATVMRTLKIHLYFNVLKNSMVSLYHFLPNKSSTCTRQEPSRGTTIKLFECLIIL